MEPTMKPINKGKGKAIGIQINELQATLRKCINPPMSKLDLDLGKAKKEKEDWKNILRRLRMKQKQ